MRHLVCGLMVTLLLIAVCTIGSRALKAESSVDGQYIDTISSVDSLSSVLFIYSSPDLERGKVLEVLEDETEVLEGFKGSLNIQMRRQLLLLEVTTGGYTGIKLEVENYGVPIDKGNQVILRMQETKHEGGAHGEIVEIVRSKYLTILLCIFVLLLLFVGGFNGFKTLITLLITGFGIFGFLLPMLLKGYNLLWVSVFTCFLVVIVTLPIIGGINKKTLASIIGTTGGVLIAGFLAWIMGNIAKLTGLGNEEAHILTYASKDIIYDFRGLLFSGVILGALGAIMDVCVSVAAAMNEVLVINPQMDRKELIRSGMRVGKDIVGTMSNTLILAYVGGSLHLMLLFMAYPITFRNIVNSDIVASEVVRALAGSIGLIASLPVTVMAVVGLQKIDLSVGMLDIEN